MKNGEEGNEVILLIHELQVISFDRFSLKPGPLISHDEQIKVNMNFVSHYLNKKKIMEEKG